MANLDLQIVTNYNHDRDNLSTDDWKVYGFFVYENIEWFIVALEGDGNVVGKQIDKNGYLMKIEVNIKNLDSDKVVLLKP